MDSKTTLGETVRALREQRGLTQEELGRLVGVGQGMIGHIETGRRQPALHTAMLLARALHVSIDELMMDEAGEMLPA